MNIAAISSMAPFSGSNQQTTVETGDGHAFAHLLSSLRQKSESVQPLSEQSEAMQRIDWEQLQQWFAQLPVHDGYADKHILSTEIIQSFLSLLPEETKEQIVQQFSAEPPFETMFSTSDDHDEKDELMLIIALFQLEQKQWTIPEPIIEYARATLRHVFEAHSEQTATIQAMLQNVVNNQLMLLNNAQKMVEWPFQQQQSWLPVHKQLVPMQQTIRTFDLLHAQQAVQSNMPLETQTSETPPASQMERIVRMPSVLHAVQQSAEKNVPIDVQMADTTSETPPASQMERIVRASQFTQWRNGNAQLLIRLHPEHLGYVTIKLIQQKGKLTAKMITSTEAAKQLVEQHIHQLAHIADHITVEQFNVFDQAKFRDHSFQQQKQQQQQQEQQREEKSERDQSFDEWLKEWFDFE